MTNEEYKAKLAGPGRRYRVKASTEGRTCPCGAAKYRRAVLCRLCSYAARREKSLRIRKGL